MTVHFNMIVAEGHWNNYSNDSVKKLFELLSDLLKGSNNAYKYLNFADSTSFAASLKAITNNDVFKYLYLGSHGNKEGVYGSDKAKAISRTTLKNSLSNYTGLYLGTCLFGTEENCKWLVDNSNLTWCAGYKNSIDWIDSSAFDMAFWKEFQIQNFRNKQNNLTLSESDILREALGALKAKYSSLILDLGFNVAIKENNSVSMAF